MEQTNQTKKRSREEMVGGRSSNGGGRSGRSGGGRGSGQANSRKKKSKSKNNNNETPHWVLDYKKSQQSNDQDHNVEARRTRSEAEAGEKQQAANVQEAPVDAETQDLMDQIKDVA